jgi:hypothetical protein
MKQLTPIQKRAIIIVAAILAAIHFAPGLIHQFSSQAHASKPTPAHIAPVAPPSPLVVPISPDVAERAKYLGSWSGSQLMPDQNNCKISLTLETSLEDQTKVAGHEIKSCIPTSPFRGGKLKKDDIPTLILETAPEYAEITGTLTKGDFAFTIDKVAGTPPGSCELTQFSVSPFGPGKLLAQWQSGKCGGGQMLLLKTRG